MKKFLNFALKVFGAIIIIVFVVSKASKITYSMSTKASPTQHAAGIEKPFSIVAKPGQWTKVEIPSGYQVDFDDKTAPDDILLIRCGGQNLEVHGHKPDLYLEDRNSGKIEFSSGRADREIQITITRGPKHLFVQR